MIALLGLVGCQQVRVDETVRPIPDAASYPVWFTDGLSARGLAVGYATAPSWVSELPKEDGWQFSVGVSTAFSREHVA